MQEGAEGGHVVGRAPVPDMGQGQCRAAAAFDGAQPSSVLAARSDPDMRVINNGVVTWATTTQIMLGGPALPEGQGIVNVLPKKFPELMRDVDLPKVRNMVTNVNPVGGEFRGPFRPPGSEGEGLDV